MELNMLPPELIELSIDKKFIEFKLLPNTHGPISEEAVMQLLTLPEFNQLHPLENIIQKAVVQVNQLCGQDDGQFEQFFKIAERIDGQINVKIAEDKMSAQMELTAPWGGEKITIQNILQALKSSNICMGLSKIKIQTLLKEISKKQPGETCECIIATGKDCIHGVNASLERKVPLARERLLQPQEREDGTVDMHNLGSVIMVDPKDLLLVKHPATMGTSGYNIHGEVLSPIPGKDISLKVGDGTELCSSDPNQLIASVSGQPVETKTGMLVDNVLNIKDVDVGYGNVDFKGSILVTGDVHEGMVVKSTGDITIMGFVDSATLIAEGDVIVSKGIIGRQLKEKELSTKIRANGQICAQFIQYSDLEAQGDILVTKQLLHSYTKTKQKLTVSDPKGNRGDLVGGIAKADNGVIAVIIGATAGTKTEVFCAMKQSELRHQLKELDQSVKAMVVSLLELDAKINKLPPKTEWQDDEMMLAQVEVMFEEKEQLSTRRNKEQAEHDHLELEVNNYYRDHHVEAHKHIFPNVELHIGPAFNRTQREHGTCMVFNQDQELTFDYSTKH